MSEWDAKEQMARAAAFPPKYVGPKPGQKARRLDLETVRLDPALKGVVHLMVHGSEQMGHRTGPMLKVPAEMIPGDFRKIVYRIALIDNIARLDGMVGSVGQIVRSTAAAVPREHQFKPLLAKEACRLKALRLRRGKAGVVRDAGDFEKRNIIYQAAVFIADFEALIQFSLQDDCRPESKYGHH
jgi:hypothetical protein